MACRDCEATLNVRRPHFYELYSSTSSSERLKIPDGFSHYMEGRTSGLVSLTGPSGNTWHVQLVKEGNDLFLHHGWPTFLEDHTIEVGDLLVFRFEGHLSFTVLVFDQRACEKEAAFISECSQYACDLNHFNAHKRSREENCSLNFVAEGLLKKLKGSTFENQQLKTDIGNKDLSLLEWVKPINMFREKGESSKEDAQLRCPTSDVAVPSQMEYNNECEEAAMQIGSGKEDDQYMHSRVCLSKLSSYDEKRVAQLFTSSYPYFVRIMKSFNISGSYTLNIPYQFSMAHLPNCKIKIILHNIKGERWTVNSVPTTRVHTSHTLCGGWMAFVRDNNIKVGDICIFELVHECELRVRIVGIGRDGIDCHVGKVAFSRPLTGHSINSHRTSQYMPIKAKVNPKCNGNVDLFDKKRSRMGQDAVLSVDAKKPGRVSKTSRKTGICPVSKAAHIVQRRHRTDDELSSQAKAGLRMLFALDEQRVAQAFTSSFPSFVKVMKKFNVSGSYTLKIPYQFSAAYLPSYKTEVVLRNLRGDCWTVNSVPDTKGRAVHTFCGGWMAFVRDNDINFGDTCIFELVAQYEMQVYISGIGKEGLDHQNREPKSNRLAIVPSTSEHPCV
ncbi:B3 domain-containing protein Os01g0723500-like isoform X2 [Prosopis cineraria]|uniref:B3 domain-containing protein Os01g0723500-like isoform X2 n=1 Tax=Prosopis cineraria TaxID=364024 RepID=UPI00241087E5|nr:B3 domain-containing protein Os01g0723500-like isoform X2 [Prosopis cineraria]